MDHRDELTIMLIRHAESMPPKEGVGAESERERPLTARGLRDAEELADTLAADAFAQIPPARVYSSPYRRAIQTVAPIAQRHGIDIEIIEDLRERLLSPAPLPDWRAHLQRCWRDFDYAPAGGESSSRAQRRVVAVFEELRARHRGEMVVVGSHGNLISLALHTLEPRVNYDFWNAIPLPAVYRIEFRDARGRIISGPGM